MNIYLKPRLQINSVMKKIYCLLLVSLIAIPLSAQIDRTKVPPSGPAPQINLKEPQSFVLANGIQVMVVENSKLPRVSIQLLIDNPPFAEGEKAGVSALMGSLLGNGSTSISKDDFNEEVDFMGASINFGSQSARASSLSKYFPRVMELMADAASNPNFTQEEFDKEKAKLITGIKSQENDVSAIQRRLENALAYGKDHPYGEFMTVASVENVTLEDVKSFYIDYFVPANAYLVIVGDVQFDNAQELVNKYFSAWTKSSPLNFGFSTPANSTYPQINFIDMPNAVQSEISLQNLVDLKMKDPDYLPALLANRILGGGSQGRLYLNLREDKGYTYGAGASLGNDKYAPAIFSAWTSVRNAVTDSAVVEIISEVRRIVEEPVTAEDLKNAKAKYVGSFVLALEKPETIARYALNIVTEDLPSDFYTTYLERLNAVTIEEVQQAAKKYFKFSNAKIVITGKGSDVADNLENVSFDGKKIPVFYFDKEGEKIEKPNFTVELPAGINVQSVVDKYLDAIGGKDQIANIQSLKVVYEGTAMGTTIKTIERTTQGKYAQTTYMNNSPMMGVVMKDTVAYMKQGTNKVDLPPAMLKDLTYAMTILPELGMVNREGAQVTAIEKVDGRDAYRIDIPGELVQGSFFYDVETGLKVKEISIITSNGQEQRQESILKDYQEIQGIKFAGIKIGTLGTEVLESKLLEAVVNAPLTDSDFE